MLFAQIYTHNIVLSRSHNLSISDNILPIRVLAQVDRNQQDR
jgi:hypothetical protein